MILRDTDVAVDHVVPTDPFEPARANAHLTSVHWDFLNREKAPLVEGIHPYPAKFIGEIPRALMTYLPLPTGTIIFDPFAGSGTTMVEAQRRGVQSAGVDLNPIACLIARVKTAETPVDLLRVAHRIVDVAQADRHPKRWSIPNVDHWFKRPIQKAIASLLEEINCVQDRQMHDALRLALSSILVRVSNQDSDTRYAAVEKNIDREDVFGEFLKAILKVNRALEARDWKLPPAQVIEANTLTLDPRTVNGRVGLVITSPPYPNAYEYWLYHKYRMWWLGFDPLAVKSQEIGARAHFFKRHHHTENNFVDQMRATFKLIDRLLVRTGYACFVIGRSKIHGRLVDNAAIVERAAVEAGFRTDIRFERVISANRKSFNLAHANIKTETIVVLQKV